MVVFAAVVFACYFKAVSIRVFGGRGIGGNMIKFSYPMFGAKLDKLNYVISCLLVGMIL